MTSVLEQLADSQVFLKVGSWTPLALVVTSFTTSYFSHRSHLQIDAAGVRPGWA